jgi:hypothetical protein
MKSSLLKNLAQRVSSTLKGHRKHEQGMVTDEAKERFVAVYPLYGMQDPTRINDTRGRWWEEPDTYGYVTSGVKVHRPAFIWEWRRLQSTETTDVESWWDPENHRPPICLYVSDAHLPTFGEDQEAGGINAQLDQIAQDVVLALRLMKSGWFLDPMLSERIYTASGNVHQRYMGPYRLTFHDEDIQPLAQLVFEPYQLHPDTLTTENGMKSGFPGANGAKKIFDLLQQHRALELTPFTYVALENFTHSYSYRLSPAQCATFLFTSLDAMFGGMSARRIGDLRLKTPFRKRLEAAISSARTPDCESEGRWVDVQCRQIRNALAHGRRFDFGDTASATLGRLQRIVRVLLLQYIRFAIAWRAEPAEVGKYLRKETMGNCIVAYNSLLEQISNGTVEKNLPWLYVDLCDLRPSSRPAPKVSAGEPNPSVLFRVRKVDPDERIYSTPVTFSQTVSIECRQCQQHFEGELWIIVDRDERPDLWARCLNGEIHIFRCKSGHLVEGSAHLMLHSAELECVIFCPQAGSSEAKENEIADQLMERLLKAIPVSQRKDYLSDLVIAQPIDILPELISRLEVSFNKR